MSLRSLFLWLFGTIGAGIVLGAVIGALLGFLSPEMVQMFLRDQKVADTLKTGIALGILNGAIYGFFGGAIMIVAGAVIARRKGEGA